MGERTKWTTQEILNLQLDDTVFPPRLIVGLSKWDGTNWVADQSEYVGASGLKALTDANAVELVATATPCKKVDISVLNGPVAVGFDSAVSAASGSEKGVILYPSNVPYTLYVTDLHLIFVAGANGRRVCFNYFV